MKCNQNNTCIYNPLRYNPEKHARNVYKNPIKYSEHGECPHRKDGNCFNNELQVAHIAKLRNTIIRHRAFLIATADYVKVDEHISYTDEKFIKSIGGEVTTFHNPKLGRTDRYVKINGWKSGTVKDYLKGFVSYLLAESFNYAKHTPILDKFTSINIEKWSDGVKVRLMGDIEDFNDPDIFNWETDEDEDYIWYCKQVDNIRMMIREPKPLKKEGELNTER